MESKSFIYWLQGYFELTGKDATLNKEQCEIIKNHLNMVFAYEIDPSFGDSKEKLNKIHNTKSPIINPYSPDSRDRKIMC